MSKRLLLASMLPLFMLAWLAGGPGNEVDVAIMSRMAELRASAPGPTALAALATKLGGAAFLLPAAALAALLLLLRRQPALASILTLTVLGERVLVHGLKDLLGRSRPTGGELTVDSLAFPSAHAANSMTVYLAIAIFAVPEAQRRPAMIAAALLSLLVGLTRVFLGVHWTSDVVGGWALGLVTVGLASSIALRSGALPVETKHEVVGRHGDAAREEETP